MDELIEILNIIGNVKVEINCTSSEAKVKITNEGDIDTKMLNMIDVKGLAADEAKDKLTELGFTNIKSNTSDGSGILFSDLYQVINQNIEPNTEIISNTEIVLTCKSKSEIETEEKAKAAAQAIPAQITTQESTPKDQYDSTDYKIDAKYAFEEDIEDQCPFGVKFHWILGNIAQRYEGNGEWFFKVEVTITNAFGAEYDTIAEGRVDVTNGCNVTYSYIYPR